MENIMKTIALMLLLVVTNSEAIEIKIRRPYTNQIFKTSIYDVKKEDSLSVGQISINFFNDNFIPFIGNELGFNSIFDTPTGIDAMEIESEDRMKVYGWCFLLNGELGENMPGITLPKSNDDTIEWFYGYSQYDSGDWLNYCETNHLK